MSVVAAQHRVRASKQGYNPSAEKRADVPANKSRSLTFTLIPQPAPNPPGQPVPVEAPRPVVVEIPRGPEAPPPTAPAPEIGRGPEPPQSSPKVDPDEQAWQAANASSDPAQIRTYIATHPNGPHLDAAQSRYDDLSWSRVDKTKSEALRGYISQFPNGAHRQEALDELAWNGVDKANSAALQKFVEQNAGNPHKAEAQSLIETLRKQEQARLAAQGIQEALRAFNLAFEHRKPAELRKIWPRAQDRYLSAMNEANSTFLLALRPTAPPVIVGNNATVTCELDNKTILRGQTTQNPPKTVKVVLQNTAMGWQIIDPFAPN